MDFSEIHNIPATTAELVPLTALQTDWQEKMDRIYLSQVGGNIRPADRVPIEQNIDILPADYVNVLADGSNLMSMTAVEGGYRMGIAVDSENIFYFRFNEAATRDFVIRWSNNQERYWNEEYSFDTFLARLASGENVGFEISIFEIRTDGATPGWHETAGNWGMIRTLAEAVLDEPITVDSVDGVKVTFSSLSSIIFASTVGREYYTAEALEQIDDVLSQYDLPGVMIHFY